MVMMSKTDVVVNYDTDIILPVSSYTTAVEMLSGECDVVYPYKFGEMGERKVNLPLTIDTQEDMDGFENNDWVKSFIESDYSPDIFDQNAFSSSECKWSWVGREEWFSSSTDKFTLMVTWRTRGSLICPEDVERHHRWKTLGYNIGRVNIHAYHLEHDRTQNSWYT